MKKFTFYLVNSDKSGRHYKAILDIGDVVEKVYEFPAGVNGEILSYDQLQVLGPLMDLSSK